MCKFKSAIVTRNGDIFTADETDSHEVLIAAHGFIDSGSPLAARSWVRVEFTPPDKVEEILDPTKWELRVDEVGAPDWWDEKKDSVRSDLWSRVKRCIVNDERKCLIGGVWILLPGSKVHQMVGSRIISAAGANLYGANLYGANLYGADLSGANLSRANLYGANLPNGWKLENGILVKI